VRREFGYYSRFVSRGPRPRALLMPAVMRGTSQRRGDSILGATGRGAIDHNARCQTLELTSRLRPKAVPVDKGPVDFDAEAGSVAEVQVTVAQFRVLAE
jgi:hypothetical protein